MGSTQEWSVVPAAGMSFGMTGGRRPSAAVVRRTSAALDHVASEAIVVRVREQQRALIASDVVENVTALSAFEGQCIEMAPLAEPRLKAVVDGYTLAALGAISRYGR